MYEKQALCLREVSSDFEAVKMAYPYLEEDDELRDMGRFIQIYIKVRTML